MAKGNKQKEETAEAAEQAPTQAAQSEQEQAPNKGQGRAVTLPNGQRRIDYIRDQYYKENVKRGDIRKNINTMLEEAGRKNEQIPYQIVFAATKTGKQGDASTDPRNKSDTTPAAATDGDGAAAE